MSITAYQLEAVGHDRSGRDFGYVNIMYRYGDKKYCPYFVFKGTSEYLGVCFFDSVDYGFLTDGAEFLIYDGVNAVGCGHVIRRTIPRRIK